MTPTNNIDNTRLFGSICLDDILKELIVTGSNGKHYLQEIIDKKREPGNNSHIGDLRPSTAPTRSAMRAEQHREYVERKRLEAMEEQPQDDKRNTYGQ